MPVPSVLPSRGIVIAGLALAALGCPPPLAAQQTDDLGRLFLTPEKRGILERQRQLNVERALVMEGNQLRLDGVMVRSSGRSTVWINGIAHQDGQAASEVRSRIDPRDPSRVTLAVGEEAPAQLRVGESVNRATRERDDRLQGGELSVRPARRPLQTPAGP
jgi:hypothetical protein